jgi:hypothetical protein
VLTRAADRDHTATVEIAARTFVEEIGHAKFFRRPVTSTK